jgi:hypothetical protein
VRDGTQHQPTGGSEKMHGPPRHPGTRPLAFGKVYNVRHYQRPLLGLVAATSKLLRPSPCGPGHGYENELDGSRGPSHSFNPESSSNAPERR